MKFYKSLFLFFILVLSFVFIHSSVFITKASPIPLEIISVTGGDGFSTILEANGDIWVWGRNDAYQLGLGDTVDRYYPEKIPSASFDGKVIQISSNKSITIARTDSGNVYVWGNTQRTPRLLHNDPTIIQVDVANASISGGHYSHHILKSNGEISSSGSTYFGMMGNGLIFYGSSGSCSSSYFTNPTDFSRKVLSSSVIETCPSNSSYKRIISETPYQNITQFSTLMGDHEAVGKTSDNKIFYWGYSAPIPIEMAVPAGISIDKVIYGPLIFFLTTEGEVYSYSSLSSSPTLLSFGATGERVVDIESSSEHTLFLMSDNSLYGFGSNNSGQLGNNIPLIGTNTIQDTGLRNIINIGTGATHSILVTDTFEVRVLGSNDFGELAEVNSNNKTSFVHNSLISNVKDIYAAGNNSFVATTDDKFWVWGERAPNFRSGPSNIPGLLKDFSNISSIKKLTGYSDKENYFGSLVLENGQIFTYGPNWKQGNGRTGSTYVPLPLIDFHSILDPSEEFMTDGFQSSYHGLSVNDNGDLFTWGYDGDYLLGRDYIHQTFEGGIYRPDGEYAFVRPLVDENIIFKNVFAGDGHLFALDSIGDVYVWGINQHNALGMFGNFSKPTKLTTLPTKIKSIGSSLKHTIFLDQEGDLWSIGLNEFGNLGLGHTDNINSLTKINSLDDVNIIDLFVSPKSTFALSDQGVLYAWGDNRYGQLGLGDFIQRNEPRIVTDFNGLGVKRVVGGDKHSLLLLNNGDLYVTGSDSYGQLGLQQDSINTEAKTVEFSPIVSIHSDNNQTFSLTDSLLIDGAIENRNEGTIVNVNYEILNIDGIYQQGFVKQYTSNSTAEPYNFSVDFDGFSLGNYTLVIRASTDTGISGEEYINFKIEDQINPLISATFSPNNANGWKSENVYFDVIASDTGGSGFSNFKYALTNSATKPNFWEETRSESNIRIPVSKSGILYLHLEAFDGDGNQFYTNSGPHYIDQEQPNITFLEPPKWQQEELTIEVVVTDLSDVVTKKWLPGLQSTENVKSNGTNFTNDFIATENGSYSVYVRDENGQESFSSYFVSNINKQPSLNSVSQHFIVPYFNKNFLSVDSNFTHIDADDEVYGNLSNLFLTSINNTSGIVYNHDVNFLFDISHLSENVFYSDMFNLFDSHNGNSNDVPVSFEIYNPFFTASSRINGIMLTWEHNQLNQQYKIFRDGVEIINTSQNFFSDSGVSNDVVYEYELYVFVNNSYQLADQLSKLHQSFIFSAPTSIQFPSTVIGDSTIKNATSIIGDPLIYEDLSEQKNPFSLRVSLSDFSSGSQNFIASNAFISSFPIYDKNNFVLFYSPDVPLNSFGTDIHSSSANDALLNPYLRFGFEPDNFEIQIPFNVHTGGVDSNFESTLEWELIWSPQ